MSIADNIASVRGRIADAAKRAGTAPEGITLIAVTKTVDSSAVREAIAAGITDIGENYVQDAAKKFDEIGREVRWHMIGHLQKNKVRQAAPVFDVIQSVDSLALAEEIGKRAEAEVLIEVNISGEESKFGVSPEEALPLCERVASVPGITLAGLMGIGPLSADEGSVRKSFARLRSLWEKLPAENRVFLSMGMTGDFETAIEEGSNMVRVGTAIFGPRRY
ncbi:MAG: YggS family pyridoxal phosphate-dependent enzyme [Armatimonadota bacterium]